MAKVKSEHLVNTALKTRTPGQAMAYLSKLYDARGDTEYLKACGALLKRLDEPAHVIDATIQSMLATMFGRAGEDRTGAFDKIRAQKLAPTYFSMVEGLREKVTVPAHQPARRRVNRLLVLTGQYLDPPHSPSVVALGLAHLMLQQDTAECAIFDWLKWTRQPHGRFRPQFAANIHPNAVGDVTHDFVKSYKGVDVPVWFEGPAGVDEGKLQAAIDRIDAYDPDAIIAIGDANVLVDLIAQTWPVVQWSNVQREQISTAPLHIHLTNAPPQGLIDWKKLGRPAPHYARKDFVIDELPEKTKDLSRDHLQLKQGDFVYAIVGNRLTEELTPAFQQTMARILAASPLARMVIVGASQLTLVPELVARRDQLRVLGFTPHLREVLNLCDAFLNPPRQGGGTASLLAIIEGLPILTLKNCDVEVQIRKGGAVDTVDALEALAIAVMRDDALRQDYIDRSQRQLAEDAAERPPEVSRQRLLAHCAHAGALLAERVGSSVALA